MASPRLTSPLMISRSVSAECGVRDQGAVFSCLMYQMFYSRCGYKFSQPVCAFGGSSSLNLGNFAKMSPSNGSTTPPAPANVKSTVSSSAPAPPGPPPPPPPAPAVKTSQGHADPPPEMVAACAGAYRVPSLPSPLPTIHTVPDIDMSGRKQKNSEDSGDKMFMKKMLL